MAHEPPVHPGHPNGAPAAPGEEAYVPPTMQGVMFAVALARSTLADFCVLWQTGALFSTSTEMFGGRGEFLSTRTTLKGKRGAHRISAAGLRAYADGCPQLSFVDLTGCSEVATEAALIALSQGCPQLSSLNLYYCDLITDACVSALRQAYPNIYI